MNDTLRRLASIALCTLALLLLLYALGGSDGRRRRLRAATRQLFGAVQPRHIDRSHLKREAADVPHQTSGGTNE
jgi:hypothetical protein